MENNNNKKSSYKNDRRSRRRNISSTSSIENTEHNNRNQTRKDLKNFIKIFKQKSKNIQRLLEEFENLDNQVCNRENVYDDDNFNQNFDDNRNKIATRSKIQTRSSLKLLPGKNKIEGNNNPVTSFSKNFCHHVNQPYLSYTPCKLDLACSQNIELKSIISTLKKSYQTKENCLKSLKNATLKNVNEVSHIHQRVRFIKNKNIYITDHIKIFQQYVRNKVDDCLVDHQVLCNSRTMLIENLSTTLFPIGVIIPLLTQTQEEQQELHQTNRFLTTKTGSLPNRNSKHMSSEHSDCSANLNSLSGGGKTFTCVELDHLQPLNDGNNNNISNVPYLSQASENEILSDTENPFNHSRESFDKLQNPSQLNQMDMESSKYLLYNPAAENPTDNTNNKGILQNINYLDKMNYRYLINNNAESVREIEISERKLDKEMLLNEAITTKIHKSGHWIREKRERRTKPKIVRRNFGNNKNSNNYSISRSRSGSNDRDRLGHHMTYNAQHYDGNVTSDFENLNNKFKVNDNDGPNNNFNSQFSDPIIVNKSNSLVEKQREKDANKKKKKRKNIDNERQTYIISNENCFSNWILELHLCAEVETHWLGGGIFLAWFF